MDRSSLVFCLAALSISLGVSVVGFRLAAMPPAAVIAARTPTPPENLPAITLGDGFGTVSAIDLVGYYIDNPPAPAAPAAANAIRHFGGC